MFWIAESDAVIKDSDLYLSLHQVMPLSIWGIFFFLGGVCLILGSVFLPTINHSKKAALFIMIGGLISSIFYFIMSTVGVYNALNWLSWVQYLTFWALTAILTLCRRLVTYGEEVVDKYVLRHEWEHSRGSKIHQRINEVDQKHDDKYHSLEIAIVR
ncbi:hypothetical protein JRU67_09125 [Mammaliicoccus sciuri]|uniref:Uncharacterized protein n=1 Tax=Mammaliicoccus sciuri TaxID=1296 RepID=A0AB37HRD8_MAMSC|nr:hypothetical protein [Mammaliicoccus sciuri]QRN90224.1 hypothetical protein JRU67_09125 [Mammaliicoccus sciuri]